MAVYFIVYATDCMCFVTLYLIASGSNFRASARTCVVLRGPNVRVFSSIHKHMRKHQNAWACQKRSTCQIWHSLGDALWRPSDCNRCLGMRQSRREIEIYDRVSWDHISTKKALDFLLT